MSETASTTDSTTLSDAPSSSAPETASAPPPAQTDRTSPSSGSDSTSPSSGDSHKSDREGLLAAVLKVVPTKPEAPAVPSEPDQADADAADQDKTGPDQVAEGTSQEPLPADQGPTQPAPDTPLPDPTESDLKKLRPETRKRIEQLLAQRNEARTAWDQAQPELQAHRQLRGYLEQHQLAPDDVNMLLGVGASLRRGDFQAFLNGVAPYVTLAQEALGLRISPDIYKQVEDGTISEEAARELTRTRYRAVQAEHRLNQTTQQAQTDAQTRNVQDIRAAVDQLENDLKTSDPDYAHKAVAVRRFSQALMQERGVPQTKQQAVELVRAAYDEATREMNRMRPAPRPTRPAPSSIQVATGTVTSEPKTMKEAALRALAQMRRAS